MLFSSTGTYNVLIHARRFRDDHQIPDKPYAEILRFTKRDSQEHKMAAIPIVQDDFVVLEVHQGSCRRLQRTEEHILLPKKYVPSEFTTCVAQRSTCPAIYWLIIDGRRWRNACYCTQCRSLFNGSGGNLRVHAAGHTRVHQHTEEEKDAAFLLFLIRHYVGLTSLRDPLTDIFYPNLSFSRAMNLTESYTQQIQDAIIEEIDDQKVFLMIAGWSDQSLRRFLGVVVSYFQRERNERVYRALSLHWGDGKDHTAKSQIEAIQTILSKYNIFRRNCAGLCADSAAVNTAIAEKMELTWCPCYVHQWNLIVRCFLDNSPPELRDLLRRINELRKKTRWVEFMTRNSTRRNIDGYTPTRWCSAVDCLDSFYTNIDLVKAFCNEQGRKAHIQFDEHDQILVESIRNVLLRFREANQMLIEADKREGLATVFETANAVYRMLQGKLGLDWAFDRAIRGAVSDIEARFFDVTAKSSCPVLFAGVLNVQHSIPDWLENRLELVASLLAEEVEHFRGSTPPGTPHEVPDDRYADTNSLAQMIDCSAPMSESSSMAVEEVIQFLQIRPTLKKQTYTRFWNDFDRFRHLQAFALSLRDVPTNTVWIERSFSKARRILSWSRMRLAPKTAERLWLLSCNVELADKIFGTCERVDEETTPDSDEEVIEDEDE